MSTVAAPTAVSFSSWQRVFSWRAVIGLSAMAAAHIPILLRYIDGIIDIPHYEFVMLLPIGAAVLFWPRSRQLGELQPGRGVGFAIWISVAISVLMMSVVLDSPWFGAIASMFAVMSIGYAVGGRRMVWALMPAWALLWLGIRLPLTADERLAQRLQQIAAVRASSVMNYLNQDHILDGNVVETPKKRYMVEEACSGVQSLFAITACTMFFALWMREPFGRVLLLMGVAWWWVWVANVVRVIAVTILNSKWNIPVDAGWGHDALSIVLFAITLALIVSSEHLLLFFLPRGIFTAKEKLDSGALRPIPDYGKTRLPALQRTWLASPALAVAYFLLFTLQLLPQLYPPERTATPTTLNYLEASLAPPQLAGWTLLPDGFEAEQRRADSQWGAYSRTWRYGKGSKEMVVSIDYPFHGWHELTICYRADGWDLESRKVVGVPREGVAAEVVAPGEKCVETVLHRPEIGSYAFLLFSSFNDRQEALPVAEELNLYQRLVDRLNGFVVRMKTFGASGGGMNDQVQSFQLQVFMQGQATPTQEDGQEALAMFSEFRTRIGQFLKAQAAQGGAQ